MGQRISSKQLLAVVERINNACGTEQGYYHLDYAYGGFRLFRQDGVDLLSTGFVSKAILWDNLHSFLRGIAIGKELK